MEGCGRHEAQALHTRARVIRIPAKAVRLAETAVRLAPDNDVYLRHLLKVQLHAGLRPDAIKTGRKLVELTPDDYRAHALLGSLLAEAAGGERELAEAEEHLNLAVALPACAATRNYGLGLVALRRGKLGGAVRELREAARLDPRPKITFYKLAQAELKAGHAAEQTDTRRERP